MYLSCIWFNLIDCPYNLFLDANVSFALMQATLHYLLGQDGHPGSKGEPGIPGEHGLPGLPGTN